jgi:cytidine deaminase
MVNWIFPDFHFLPYQFPNLFSRLLLDPDQNEFSTGQQRPTRFNSKRGGTSVQRFRRSQNQSILSESNVAFANCYGPQANASSGPYSKFQVGCSLLLKEPSVLGQTITGANVENAAYPVGTCAERVAIGTAVAAGLRYGAFKAIAVATNTIEPASPCGMCRQFIREFCELSTPIFMFNKDGDRVVRTLGEVSSMLVIYIIIIY